MSRVKYMDEEVVIRKAMEALIKELGPVEAIRFINPVVALNSALGFIKTLTIKAQPLNQCDPLDQPNSDL